MTSDTGAEQKASEPIKIKKYANRRLYNTDSSTYVTLDDLAQMVREERDFVVVDAKTSEDLTHGVLTQIILDQESKGHNLLPVSFLRQLIRFYDDSMARLVPSYLDMSLSSLAREQERLREQFTSTFAGTPMEVPMEAMQRQAQQNLAMFEKALAMFNPFQMPPVDPSAANGAATNEGEPGVAANQPAPRQAAVAGEASKEEIEKLQRQLTEMQRQLANLSSGKE